MQQKDNDMEIHYTYSMCFKWIQIIKLGVCLSYPDSDELFKSKVINVCPEGEFAGLAFAFRNPLLLTCRVSVA